ncbi:hypothetical protein Tsubulata_039036, partial [Turnera subulata]
LGCVRTVQSKITAHSSIGRGKNPAMHIIKGTVVIQNYGESGPGKSAALQVYSGTVVDPSTGKGKLSQEAYLKHGKSEKKDGRKTITYKIKLRVEPQFGVPGAVLVINQHRNKFFLESVNLATQDNHIIHFDCRSWIYPIKYTASGRLFFSNTSYLPNQTPSALVVLRKSELRSLRGDGTGERKEWDRIYDYDCYNDLGDPDKGREYIRPVLGGSALHPYPRRIRTGRPRSNTDPSRESRPQMINLDAFVPPDERCSPKRLSEIIANSIQASVHFLIPEARSLLKPDSSGFESFNEMRGMFSGKRSQMVGGKVKEELKKVVPDELFKEITQASKKDCFKFPLPQIINGAAPCFLLLRSIEPRVWNSMYLSNSFCIALSFFHAEDELAWRSDEEFGRQMLAGINPARIKCLQ